MNWSTWGVSSSSSSPERYCLSNSAFSPTYDDIMRFICLLFRSMPRPKLSTLQSQTLYSYNSHTWNRIICLCCSKTGFPSVTFSSLFIFTPSDYLPAICLSLIVQDKKLLSTSSTSGNSKYTSPYWHLSHPALLLTAVMPFTPVFSRLLIRFSGIPHKPKPGREKGEIKHTHNNIAWGHIMFYLYSKGNTT